MTREGVLRQTALCAILREYIKGDVMGVIIFVLAVIGFFLLYSGVFDRFSQKGAVMAHVARIEPEDNVPYYACRTSADRTSYHIYLTYFDSETGDYIDARSDRVYPVSKWMPGDEVEVRPSRCLGDPIGVMYDI